jgi:hypothetical protein
LGDASGVSAGRLQHAAGLGGVHGHARLAQDVLAGVQRGDRDGAVEIGPRPDADCVDGRVGDQVLPPVEDPRNAELTGDELR